MSLKGIISISGMAGLYKVLAQSKSGFIVESLIDKKRMPVSSTQRISMLQDITIFSTGDDLQLTDVLLKMKDYAEKNTLIDPKSDPAKLKEFFGKVVPDFDAEKVYASDIKKIITWFHLVKDVVAIVDEPEVEETVEAVAENVTEEVKVAEEKPAKKKRAAKSSDASDEEGSKPEATKTAAKPRKKKETQ